VHLGQYVLAWLQRHCSVETDKGPFEFQFAIHFVILWVKSCYYHANITLIASDTIPLSILPLPSSLSWEVYLWVSQPSFSPVQSKQICRERRMLLHRSKAAMRSGASSMLS